MLADSCAWPAARVFSFFMQKREGISKKEKNHHFLQLFKCIVKKNQPSKLFFAIVRISDSKQCRSLPSENKSSRVSPAASDLLPLRCSHQDFSFICWNTPGKKYTYRFVRMSAKWWYSWKIVLEKFITEFFNFPVIRFLSPRFHQQPRGAKEREHGESKNWLSQLSRATRVERGWAAVGLVMKFRFIC